MHNIKLIILYALSIVFLTTSIVSSTATCSQPLEQELYRGLKKIFANSYYLKIQHKSIPKDHLCSLLNDSIPSKIMKNYLQKIDEYGKYISKEEFKAYEETQSENYAGLGMFLYQQKHHEDILCIPVDDRLNKRLFVK